MISDWLDRLFNRHKLVRRGIVIWACWLITTIVLKTWEDVSLINASVISGLSVIVGILASALAHYKWSRDKDDSSGE